MTRKVAPTGFGGPEQLALTTVPTPEPGEGQVRLAVRAIGVNPIDWKLYSGAMGTDPSLLGSIGVDAAGVVEAVGAGVDAWSEGDEVIASTVSGGAYADQIIATAETLTAKPAGLSFEQAASVPVVGGTAVHALEAAGVGAGDTVLVHGAAGGVGSLTVQLARLRGARVIGTASASNHDYLRSLGAEPVEYGPGLLERVRALAPEGVDAAVDTVGSDEALDTSVALVADPKRVVTIAGFGRAAELGITAIGGDGSGAEIRRAAVGEVAGLVADGTLTLPIERTYPLTETAAAHRDSKAAHTRGKLVVVP